jgi:sister-chromatid-cohesion protein PDS5
LAVGVVDARSQRLYLLSEIADYVIKERAQNQGWTIPPYPNAVGMPKDIMRPLSPEAAKRVRSKVYLTEEMIEVLGEVGKNPKSIQPKVDL